MKTNYFFVIFLFCASASFAQVNSYFQNSPEWQGSSSCAWSYPCIENETYNYFINGDTVFNSLTYKKIFRKGEGYYAWMAPPPSPGCGGTYSYTDTLPSYFLRSFNKQMYVRHLGDTGEFLLYDFNLAIGDTLPLSFNNYANDITVTAIDSIFTPYGYRKRFALAGNTWANYLIEGIGHSKGLFEPINVPLECGFDLLCYSLNDSAYYPNPGPSCDLILGNMQITTAINASVFPNPFSDQTTIQLNQNVTNAELIVYNINGKEISKTIFTGNNFTFSRGNLSAGVYFYTIKSTEQRLMNGKLIIID